MLLNQLLYRNKYYNVILFILWIYINIKNNYLVKFKIIIDMLLNIYEV